MPKKNLEKNLPPSSPPISIEDGSPRVLVEVITNMYCGFLMCAQYIGLIFFYLAGVVLFQSFLILFHLFDIFCVFVDVTENGHELLIKTNLNDAA